MFGQRGVDRVATPAANSQKADALLGYLRQPHPIIDATRYILDTEGRVLVVPGLAAAFTLIRRVEGERRLTLQGLDEARTADLLSRGITIIYGI